MNYLCLLIQMESLTHEDIKLPLMQRKVERQKPKMLMVPRVEGRHTRNRKETFIVEKISSFVGFVANGILGSRFKLKSNSWFL